MKGQVRIVGEFFIGRMTKSKKIALPTTDEQKNLQQVEVLMRTNLLNLQVSELLVQVGGEQIFQKKRVHQFIEELLTDIKSATVNFKRKAGSGASTSELSFAWLRKQSFGGIYPHERLFEQSMTSTLTKIDFEKPLQVELIGSYVYHTSTAPFLNVDVAVAMPKSMFDARYQA